jgi:hypothetical protein
MSTAFVKVSVRQKKTETTKRETKIRYKLKVDYNNYGHHRIVVKNGKTTNQKLATTFVLGPYFCSFTVIMK